MTQAEPLGVVADIGGTNARFATVVRDADGRLQPQDHRTLRTADHPSFESAYQAFASGLAQAPGRAVFAIASPIVGDEIKMTNSPWVLRPSTLAARLGLDEVRLINDFEAIARSVAVIPPAQFRGLGGKAFVLAGDGVVSIVGPGSGLGVALLVRDGGRDRVIPCEGGHSGFAPADEIDIHILRFVSERYPRVSAERLISGPGLVQIYIALAELEGRAIVPPHTVTLWKSALSGSDPHAVAAAERWLMLLGSFAGDMALSHGAAAVALAGGILPRFGDRLEEGPLLGRFRAKGRFEALMHRIPIALVTHPEPGLLGAATLLEAR